MQYETRSLVPRSRRAWWRAWLPLVVLPAAAMLARAQLPPWAFMWLLAIAIWFGCKWLVYVQAAGRRMIPLGRTLVFFAWPGMEAERFLNIDASVAQARRHEGVSRASPHAFVPSYLRAFAVRPWIGPSVKAVTGMALLWLVARQVPQEHALVRGWIGMLGLILLLHFGTFHLLALRLQRAGIAAEPLMRQPLLARSLGHFWNRWNRGFHELGHVHLFRPLQRRIGPAGAMLAVFLASGLVHDLVISLPSRGGYGLPTLYFLMQGGGVLIERSALGRRLGLREGWRGWTFAAFLTVAPLPLLFHSPFVIRVILPFMEAIGAL